MSELKDICVNLETAKRLKENGFPQDSLFYWEKRLNHKTNKFDIFVITEKDELTPKILENISALTSEEIFKKLPAYIDSEFEDEPYYLYIFVNDWIYIGYKNRHKIYYQMNTLTLNLAEAFSQMYEYLADNKLFLSDVLVDPEKLPANPHSLL